MYDAIDKNEMGSYGYYEDDQEESQLGENHDEEQNYNDNARTDGSSKAHSNHDGLRSSLRSTSLIRDASTASSGSPIFGGIGFSILLSIFGNMKDAKTIDGKTVASASDTSFPQIYGPASSMRSAIL